MTVVIVGGEKPSLEDLVHYGVKGMRWGRLGFKSRGLKRRLRNRSDHDAGIRNDPNRSDHDVNKRDRDGADKRNRDSSRRAFNKVADFSTRINGPMMKSVLAGMDATTDILRKIGSMTLIKGRNESQLRVGRNLVNMLLEGHGDRPIGDVMFPPQQEFRRMSKVAETQLKVGNYMTYRPEDIAKYSSEWHGKYDVNIRAKDSVKSPSLKTRFKTMAELIDEKPGDGGKTIREVLMDRETSQAAKNWIRVAAKSDLGKYTYGSLTGIKWDDDPIGKLYISRLRDKGYDVMLDDRDAGINNYAVDPLVVINPDKFEVSGSVVRTLKDRDDAREVYLKNKKLGVYT